ncbi:preprotein translocase subunit SecB [Lacticaseibacillus paracasei]|jgi:preprotein translocase subunit SecB|nr:preprotein translocase subunit SecB [Lacticaseibacillus paracasei]
MKKKPESNTSVPVETHVETGTTEDLSKGKITLVLTTKVFPHDLKLVVSGFFLLNVNDYPKEQVLQALVTNGTAIMYPYLRSMISVLTGLGTENALILPTINTNNLLKEEKN